MTTRHPIDEPAGRISPEVGYRALASRDRRFDGRFFVGVTSTGIYCRPVCPARTPARAHVRFFPCSAAAERAGFRPCRRCRPESAPGSPAWTGTTSVVARALRLIGEGALDGGDAASLAERLGIGDRHLRRLFERHLGASPAAIARSRRAHFAKRLLHDSDLPMSAISHAAGFGSVRRFNTTMRAIFQSSPTEIRAAARGGRTPRRAAPVGRFSLRIPYRPPYDWTAMLDYLGPRAVPGVEVVADGAYRRAVVLGSGVTGVIEVREASSGPALAVIVRTSGSPPLFALTERLRRLFDVDADAAHIDAHLARDPLLARVISRHPGQRLPGAFDPFELAVRAIVGQQVTVRAATTITGRIAARLGRAVDDVGPGWPTHLFPTPAILARGGLDAIGMPGARARAIVELARRVDDGRIVLDGSRPAEEVRGALLAVPGIGPWTADYVLIRSLGEPDAFLPGDLGVRVALGNGKGPAPPRRAAERAEAWRPWRAYGMLYLWRLLPTAGGSDRETTR